MLLFMKGSILIEGPVSILPIVSALGELLICAIHHVIYLAWNQVMALYELVDHFLITMLLG